MAFKILSICSLLALTMGRMFVDDVDVNMISSNVKRNQDLNDLSSSEALDLLHKLANNGSLPPLPPNPLENLPTELPLPPLENLPTEPTMPEVSEGTNES
uniref:Uncharacterized protein n=1 Tax=Panagrolaimus sp. JU765 TaxID=591449 RepID=A0AC34R2G8_9BILA